MKKVLSMIRVNGLWIYAVVLSVPLVAMADATPQETLAQWIADAVSLGKTLGQLGVWAAFSAVVKLLVDATKTEFLGGLFDKLGPAGKGLLISVLSVLSVGTTVLAAGGSIFNALVAVIGSAAGAVFLNELFGLIQAAIAPKP